MQMWQHMFDTYKDKSNRISVISLKKILSSLGTVHLLLATHCL